MNKQLNLILDSFNDRKKDYQIKSKFQDYKHAEALSITFHIVENIQLQLHFWFYEEESLISSNYSFVKKEKKSKPEVFNYEPRKAHDISSLPGFDINSFNQIKELYQFKTVDNQIKNKVSLDQQASGLIKIYNAIFERLKSECLEAF